MRDLEFFWASKSQSGSSEYGGGEVDGKGITLTSKSKHADSLAVTFSNERVHVGGDLGIELVEDVREL